MDYRFAWEVQVEAHQAVDHLDSECWGQGYTPGYPEQTRATHGHPES